MSDYMKILVASDLFLEIRLKTRVLYENCIKDGEDAYLSDITYKRAFEKEFRDKLDEIIESGDSIVIRDKEELDKYNTVDSHSVWLMTAQAERCFPDLFVTSKELKGMTQEERHRYLIEKKFSNSVHKTDKWTKYKKGKGKT